MHWAYLDGEKKKRGMEEEVVGQMGGIAQWAALSLGEQIMYQGIK